MEDYFFRPSKELDSYLYSIFLKYASVEELERDTLHIQTNWKLANHFDDGCKEYNVWFVDEVAVTKQPTIVDKKMIRRYYDWANPNNPLHGAIIQPNIEV
jgi:hypothetical protein